MGAWGQTVFENDAAEEWIEQLTAQGRTAFVLKPLRLISKARAGAILEAEQCQCALAAAEVIAAAQGHPCRGLPEEIRGWLKERMFVPGPNDLQLTRAAVIRLESHTELKELWGGSNIWIGGVQKLLERLERVPKGKVPATAKPAISKVPVPIKNDVGNTKLSEIRKIAKRKGGLAVIKGIPYYLGLEGVIYKDLAAISTCPECHDLKQLEISGRGITDKGMECVGQLVQLRELVLDAPAVTDAGIACLPSITNLETLTLKRTQITDAGLRYLSQIKYLQTLWVYGSPLTPKALKSFASQLGCRVVSDVLK